MMKKLTIILTIFIILIMYSGHSQTKVITKKNYPKEWCFTFTKGTLICIINETGYPEIYISVDAKKVKYNGIPMNGQVMYGLNGLAKGKSKKGNKYIDGFDDISKVLIKGKTNYQIFIPIGMKICPK